MGISDAIFVQINIVGSGCWLQVLVLQCIQCMVQGSQNPTTHKI